MQGKTCQRCGKFKPYSMFDFNANGNGDGYIGRCKSCLAIQNALRYDAKKNGERIPTFNDYHTLDGVRIFK